MAKAKTARPARKFDTTTDPLQSDDESHVPQEETDAVKAILKRVNRAKSLREHFDKQELPRMRRYVYGKVRTSDFKGDANSSSETTNIEFRERTNLIFATIATVLPHVYAKNPEIAVTPTEAVGKDEYATIKSFCETGQVVINKLLVEEARLKVRAKANVRAGMTTGVGWLKLIFQQSLKGDPIILKRHNDLQDNLRTIEYEIQKSKNETDNAKRAVLRDDIRRQQMTIESGNEVKIFKGFVVDRIKTEDVFILDESVVEFDDYVNAEELSHRVWYTGPGFEEEFGFKAPKGATTYGAPAVEADGEDGKKDQLPAGDQAVSYYAVHEIWSKKSGTVSCVCEGAKGYCRKPYTPANVPERYYPFYAWAPNPVEGRWRGMSDVELLTHLQDEYNTTRKALADAREEARTCRVFRKGGDLTEEDIRKLSKRRVGQWVGVEGNPQTDINKDIMELKGSVIDHQAYDVSVIRNDMDLMVGLSDASRSNLIQAKTATEAEIMKQALQTRVAERQDANEDMISEMAQAVLQISLRVFSKAEIVQMAGEGAQWPEEPSTVEQIFGKVRVAVRAGSTGKPNAQQERADWGQLVPVINETMQKVAELRMQGQFDMAKALIALLRETFKRYDEKLDVDTFIPPEADDAEAQKMQQMTQELQQTKEAAAKMQEELQTCQQQLAQAKLGSEAKAIEAQKRGEEAIAKAQADGAIRAAQESAKGAEAQAKGAENVAKVDADAKLQQQKIDAEYALEKMRLEQQQREFLITTAIDMLSKLGVAAAAQLAPLFDKTGTIEALVAELGAMVGDKLAADAAAPKQPDQAEVHAQQMQQLVSAMTAPKRLVRDPVSGKAVGIETVGAQPQDTSPAVKP